MKTKDEAGEFMVCAQYSSVIHGKFVQTSTNTENNASLSNSYIVNWTRQEVFFSIRNV